MNEFNRTTEHFAESYQTGRTRPPKSHGGIIAFLLMLVIFLSGIISILGIMNIHLFRMVESRDTQDISLLARCSPAESEVAEASLDDAYPQSTLGITGQEITTFYQHYYDIPRGIYITQVESDSDSYAQGLRSGDILLQFNDTRVTDSDTLKNLLHAATPGDSAQLTIYRSGSQHELTVIIGETE